jgi:hypothetical protein
MWKKKLALLCTAQLKETVINPEIYISLKGLNHISAEAIP